MDRDAYFAAELERMQRGYEAGNLPSAIEAMTLCASNALAWPEWLAAVAISSTEDAFMRSRALGAGLFESDSKHMRRYRAATYWLDMLVREKARWSAIPRKVRRVRSLEKPLLADRWPLTRPGAFLAAADAIGPTDRLATADTVRASYDLIRVAIKLGEAERYLAAETAFPLGEN